jgi:hypothetical protein
MGNGQWTMGDEGLVVGENVARDWIELLHHSGYLDTPGFTSVHAELTELLKLLTAIIKTAKSRR